MMMLRTLGLAVVSTFCLGIVACEREMPAGQAEGLPQNESPETSEPAITPAPGGAEPGAPAQSPDLPPPQSPADQPPPPPPN
jgi:hypothetical protein